MSTNSPKLGIYSSAGLLFLSPLTPLHVGSGATLSEVDLPVQKTPYGHPVIYASSLKGAIKTRLWTANKHLTKLLLGPEPDDEEKYSSPLSFTDAFLLLLPTRSSLKIPLYVTTPFLLAQAHDMVKIVSHFSDKLKRFSEILGELSRTSPGPQRAVIPETDTDVNHILIAGLPFETVTNKNAEQLRQFSEFISDALPDAYKRDLEKKIAIISEKDFLRVLERTLIVQTRIHVDRASKTVKSGMLWSEEYIPPGTLFISIALYSEQRLRNAKKLYENWKKELEKEEKTDEVKQRLSYIEEVLKNAPSNGLKTVEEKLGEYIVLGGKESIGKGIVKIKLKYYAGEPQ